MTTTLDLPSNGLVALTRASLVALRTALFRDVGPQAAAALQEAGYAGGQAMHDAFAQWLAARGLGSPDSLPATDFAARATEFFSALGWGSLAMGALDGVATVDSPDWAECDPDAPLEFPGCYFTAGVFADFFGRVAGSPVAVMEVECRSSGGQQCRFLLGSSEVMQQLYDEMSNGVDYRSAAVYGLGTSC